MGIMSLLLNAWQLPQNLLGRGLALLYVPGTWREYRGVRVLLSDRMRGGISLGRTIILSPAYCRERTLRHEWGHTRQSLLLGPLYLPLVGLPSLLWAAWWRPGRGRGYYTFFTERWADRLGEVGRPHPTDRQSP